MAGSTEQRVKSEENKRTIEQTKSEIRSTQIGPQDRKTMDPQTFRPLDLQTILFVFLENIPDIIRRYPAEGLGAYGHHRRQSACTDTSQA